MALIDPLRRSVKVGPIEGDRACPKCGYNLKGLMPGGKCPECSAPIRATTTDPLAGWVITDAGMGYLRDLGFGAVLMALCAPVVMLGIVWTVIEWPWDNGLTLWPGGAGAVAAIGWVLGVWVITGPRPTPEGTGHMEREWVWVRWLCRGSQLVWAGAVPAVVWGAHEVAEFNVNGTTAHPSAELAVRAGMTAWLVGFVGLGAVAVYLSRLADWARDTTLAERLRLVPYALGLGAFFFVFLWVLRGVIGYQGGGLVTLFFGSLGILLLMMAFGTFAWALFGFANLARWSASSRSAKLSSDARRSQIIVERIERQRARALEEDAQVEGTGSSKPQGKVIPKAVDVDPYELAPTDAPVAAPKPKKPM